MTAKRKTRRADDATRTGRNGTSSRTVRSFARTCFPTDKGVRIAFNDQPGVPCRLLSPGSSDDSMLFETGTGRSAATAARDNNSCVGDQELLIPIKLLSETGSIYLSSRTGRLPAPAFSSALLRPCLSVSGNICWALSSGLRFFRFLRWILLRRMDPRTICCHEGTVSLTQKER